MRPHRHHHDQRHVRRDRLTYLTAFVAVVTVGILVRLFDLMVLKHGVYSALADGQYTITHDLVPVRGDITVSDSEDNEEYAIATNETLKLVYAIPKRVTDPADVAKQLAGILDVDEETIKGRLEKENDLYEPIAHLVPDDVVEKVRAFNIDGIEFADESNRFYPEHESFSQVVGFVGYDGDTRTGRYGIEGYFNDLLSGTPGRISTERDAGGRWITVGDAEIVKAVNGADIHLTLDRIIQSFACDRLATAVEKHGADAGSLVILDPKTGAVLAMCSAPTYDPNAYNEVENIETFVNRSIFQAYEPGSVFKPITMAAALDMGLVTPQTTFVDTGEEHIDNYTIRNADNKTYGEQTMTQVLEESINTGAIYAARVVGTDAFRRYVQSFGFGEITGMTLDTEVAGNISSLSQPSEIYLATASFGQGMTVTPLQLANAYATIANHGLRMKPYIVDRITYADDSVEETVPKEVAQVISPETASTLSAMLVRVVENGHGKRAGVAGYYIAGKTGTAQIPLTDRAGYDSNRTIGTFAGFGPASDPAFVMVTKIDVPKDVQFAESSAAPLFGEIADFILQYKHIAPERTTDGS